MTTRTKRLANVSMGRVTTDGSEADGTPLGDQIYGKVNNIAGGAHMRPHNEGWGPIGPDNYPQDTHGLSDFTFDLIDCSEQPETLGEGDVYLNIYRSWKEDDGALTTNVRQYVGNFETEGTEAWDRTTDNPRSMVFKPYRRVDGGGEGLNDLSLDNCGFYLDTRTGEYRTRLNGTGAQIDHFAEMRAAHGV